MVTPSSTLVDEPTTFWFDGKPYEPNNYHAASYGTVSLRQALSKSMNIPTVKLAEAVGYDKVMQVAKQAGMGSALRATPAIALGAYEVTPIEAAGAYTVYANRGQFSKPFWVQTIRDSTGQHVFDAKPARKQVLDPRVNYLMVNLLEEVVHTGTGAGIRSRGFGLPAAGKTGTSHDGWFAGFTSKLVCVVWVGFDDNSELDLEGAQSALPIWTEFMKRAHTHRAYKAVAPFDAPDGIVSVSVDPATGQLATPACPNPRAEVFITGSQPLDTCRLHGGGRSLAQVSGWDGPDPAPRPEDPQQVRRPSRTSVRIDSKKPPKSGEPGATRDDPAKEEKKGFFGRIKDIFK